MKNVIFLQITNTLQIILVQVIPLILLAFTNAVFLNCFINCSLSAVQYLQSSAVSARYLRACSDLEPPIFKIPSLTESIGINSRQEDILTII